MRYAIVPDRLAERLALWFGRVPVPIADCLLPLIQTRSLMAALRLGVVDAIGREERSSADVARACTLDPDSVDMLLRVLVSAGYVSTRTGSDRRFAHYRLSPLGLRTLLPGAPAEARGYIQWNFTQWRLVEHLEATVRSGKGVDLHQTLDGDTNWQWYQQGMLDLARMAAPILAQMVPVKTGATTLVDVGGSHGLLGAAICRRHPPMRSVVIELPAALEEARAAARRAGVDDVVEHRAANVLEGDLPAADVVLLANIVHHFTREQAIVVLRKAAAALSGGGTVAVWDFDRPSRTAPPELAADASALFFHMTSTSQVVPGEEYAAWLREAGFRSVRLKRSVFAPVQVLAVGRT